MAFNFFRKSRQDGNHVVRWWVKTYGKGGDAGGSKLVPKFLAWFIGNLLSYGDSEKSGDGPKTKWSGVFGLDHPLTDDLCLFELACYRFFRFDCYLFCHHEDIREDLADVVLEDLLDLFGQALGRPLVSSIYANRIKGYGELYRSGAEGDRGIDEHLIALMCLARRGEVVVDYDFGESPMKNMGFDMFEYVESSAKVTAWIVFSQSFNMIIDEFIRLLEEGFANAEREDS